MVCSICGFSRAFHVAVNIGFDQRGAILPSLVRQGAICCRRCGSKEVVVRPKQRAVLVQWLVQVVFGAAAGQPSLFSR